MRLQKVTYALLLCLSLMMFFPAKAQKTGPDTVVVNFGKNSKIMLVIDDRRDLDSLQKFDLNSMAENLGQKLENTDSAEAAEIAPDSTGTGYNPEKDIFRNNDRMNEEERERQVRVVHVRKTRGTRHFFNVEFGMNNYLEDGSFPQDNNAPYAVRPWGSWYVALGPVVNTHIAGNLFLELGMNVSWYNFKFENDNMRIEKGDENVNFFEDPRDLDARKSKLTAAYVNLSLVPQFYFGKGNPGKGWFWDRNNGRGFRIGVGGYAGYRLDSYSKFVFEEDNKERERAHSDYFLRNFRYGLRLQTGFRGTDIFFNYDLNPLFVENRGPELNAFSFGIIF